MAFDPCDPCGPCGPWQARESYQLRCLRLGDLKLPAAAWASVLVPALQDAPNLVALDLSHNSMTSHVTAPLAALIATAPELEARPFGPP